MDRLVFDTWTVAVVAAKPKVRLIAIRTAFDIAVTVYGFCTTRNVCTTLEICSNCGRSNALTMKSNIAAA